MELKTAVEKYLAEVKQFGQPMPLVRFGLPTEELESMLATWEEDYQLHRYLVLVPADRRVSGQPEQQNSCTVHGITYTAIIFREAILDMLP